MFICIQGSFQSRSYLTRFRYVFPVAPVGPGDLGKVRYADTGLTAAQRIGGAAQPWVDAWAEKGISGDYIGGVPKMLKKIPGVEDFLEKYPFFGNVLGSAATEAIEEVPAVLPGAVARDSLANLGNQSYWNPETQQYEYQDGGPGSRFRNILRETADSAGAGALMGGTIASMSELRRLPGYLSGRNSGQASSGPRPVPDAPRMTDEEIRALDRRFQQLNPEE